MPGLRSNGPSSGQNYGWPLVTFGRGYDGKVVSPDTTRPGIEPPRFYWVPSLGITNLFFYTGDRFPEWKGELFVAGHGANLSLDGARAIVGACRQVGAPGGWSSRTIHRGERGSMGKRALAAIVAVIVGWTAGASVAAHHSHAMFDTSREVTVVGTVTSVSYRNPHVFLYIDVKGPDGQVVPWGIEMSNITNMERRGIYRSTFKEGDVVTVKVNPLKDGRPGGNYTSVTAADGKTYE